MAQPNNTYNCQQNSWWDVAYIYIVIPFITFILSLILVSFYSTAVFTTAVTSTAAGVAGAEATGDVTEVPKKVFSTSNIVLVFIGGLVVTLLPIIVNLKLIKGRIDTIKDACACDDDDD